MNIEQLREYPQEMLNGLSIIDLRFLRLEILILLEYHSKMSILNLVCKENNFVNTPFPDQESTLIEIESFIAEIDRILNH